MKCNACTKEIPDNSKFCPMCGIKIEIQNEEKSTEAVGQQTAENNIPEIMQVPTSGELGEAITKPKKKTRSQKAFEIVFKRPSGGVIVILICGLLATISFLLAGLSGARYGAGFEYIYTAFSFITAMLTVYCATKLTIEDIKK